MSIMMGFLRGREQEFRYVYSYFVLQLKSFCQSYFKKLYKYLVWILCGIKCKKDHIGRDKLITLQGRNLWGLPDPGAIYDRSARCPVK